jgi:hypothetical protein
VNRSGAGRRAPVAALAVAGLLTASGGVVLLATPPALHVAAASVPSGAGAAASAPAPGSSPTSTPAPPGAPPGGAPAVPPAVAAAVLAAVPAAFAAPARLDVPDLGLELPVVPVGVDDVGALDVPADPRVAGWWSSGAVPGAAQGSTVLAAHVDAAGVGAGPLSRLLRAPLGTVVEIGTTDGSTLRYALTERRSHAKDAGLPAELFRADGPPRLVVITCGGAFDAAAGRYADNVVLIASPA